MDQENNPAPVIGNYRVLEEIASGTFGTVYVGEHIVFAGDKAAIKVLHTHFGTSQTREKFLSEARILKKLKHPHILSIIDAGFSEGRLPYLVSDYATGGSLYDRLQPLKKRPLPMDQALHILSDIAAGLFYAHQQNIVHRDLKPANILFNANDEALIADFGVATTMTTVSVQQTTGMAGTPLYMAPEQFKGRASRGSDQYALGCIAFELFTGRPPFTGKDFYALAFQHMSEPPPDPVQLQPTLPVHIGQTILKALAKEREQRYPNVQDFFQSLQGSPQPSLEEEVPQQTDSAHAWFEQALAYQERGQHQQSLEAYKRALQLDPQFASAYGGKALALYRLGRHIEALETMKLALNLTPENATFHFGQGLIFEELQRHQEALQAYQHVLRLEPGHLQAQQNMPLLFRRKRWKVSARTRCHLPSKKGGWVGEHLQVEAFLAPPSVACGDMSHPHFSVACYASRKPFVLLLQNQG